MKQQRLWDLIQDTRRIQTKMFDDRTKWARGEFDRVYSEYKECIKELHSLTTPAPDVEVGDAVEIPLIPLYEDEENGMHLLGHIDMEVHDCQGCAMGDAVLFAAFMQRSLVLTRNLAYDVDFPNDHIVPGYKALYAGALHWLHETSGIYLKDIEED